MSEGWFDRLQAFTQKFATSIAIASIGLLPRSYDTEYRKDYYGSIERDPHEGDPERSDR